MDPSVELIRQNRSFGWYWLGQSLSMGGSQVTVVALPLVSALTLGAGPSEVGFVATAAMLPYLLFSMVAGHLVENLDKRRTMIPADVAQFVLIAAVPVAWAVGWLSVSLLAVIAFLSGTAALIFGIAGFAYVPHLVQRHELPAANRAVQGSRTVTEIAGPGIAGILISTLGPALAMTVDALSYLASAVGVALGRPQQVQAPEKHTPPSAKPATEDPPSLWTGMRILFANPYLRALTIHAAAYNLAEAVFMLNLVLWAVQGQAVSASAYGLALAAGGVGGLLGTMTALHLAGRAGLGRAFVLSLALSCGAPLLAAAWPLTGLRLAAVIATVMFVAGIGLGNANVYSLTLRQSAIPITQLARSSGAYTQVMYGSIPIGTALAGVIGETLGTRAGVLLGAAGLTLSALPMLTRRIVSLKTAAEAEERGQQESLSIEVTDSQEDADPLGAEHAQADQRLFRKSDQKGTTVHESRKPRQISIIGAPTSAGAYGPGQETTPATLRAHGLPEALAGAGHHVTDRGDGPTLTWRNDETNPTAKNVDLVATAATFLSEQVATALADGDDILGLGGDCTVELGTVAGALRDGSTVGLAYIDLDADLKTPVTGDGILDWMVVAHLLNIPDARPELACLTDHAPLLDSAAVRLFGTDNITASERAIIDEQQIHVEPVQAVRDHPEQVAARGREWAAGYDRLLVHVDVDVLDNTFFPIAENTGLRGGLRLAELTTLLTELCSLPNWRALTLTEVNPAHAPDQHSACAQLIAMLVTALNSANSTTERNGRAG